MAEVKHDFPGIAKFNATLIFTALASSSGLAFLTTGVLGRITYKALEMFGNWLANQGLALGNIGYDNIVIAAQEFNYEQVFDTVLYEILKEKNPLSPEKRKELDDKVIIAFRKFASFT